MEIHKKTQLGNTENKTNNIKRQVFKFETRGDIEQSNDCKRKKWTSKKK